MEFRSILIDISNQLSDANRHAFHFALGKVIPRKCRDDCTPDGTLRLLDCLFERGFIADDNFDNLINIFEQIQCFDIVEQLNEYRSRLIHTSIAEPVSPSCTDDGIQSSIAYSHSMSVNGSPSSDELVAELLCGNIQSRTIALPKETYTVNERKIKKRFSIVRSILYSKSNQLYMKLIIIFILSMILLLLSFCAIRHLRKSNFEEQSSLRQHEFVYTMKEGSPYGNKLFWTNRSFDDARDLLLSYTDCCIGIRLEWTNISLKSVRFLYSNNQSSHLAIPEERLFSDTFMLQSNENINKINMYTNNGTIVGIQLCTTDGRKSSVFGSTNGHFLTESFENYTFSYATGKQHNDQIVMLQFHWMKRTSSKEKIITEARNMREICEFIFLSNKTADRTIVYAQGIESSWYDLKRKLHREGDAYDMAASYYQKTRQKDRGPELFAIINSDTVFYHHNNQWHMYNSARNVSCSIRPWSD
ncbi:unnamed protein product [Adineta ricciae]|uniref:DED domain-containing protein n=1 Tax=Adineta ricciae TaxID=249248 RepID=A0A814AI54_ADIRI|nr:unnamed protein product [Adineta ricciae]